MFFLIAKTFLKNYLLQMKSGKSVIQNSSGKIGERQINAKFGS